MAESITRRTPLYEVHVEERARMVPFAGWEMPVQYAGILEESRAVRAAAGLFDISHMGRVVVSGPDSAAFLDSLTTNDVTGLATARAHYSLLTNPQGGIVDDIIVYRRGADEFLVVLNASNAEKDLAWMRAHAPSGISIEDQTDRTAMIAVQGPAAPLIVENLAEADIIGLERFAHTDGRVAGAPATVCRTGYTGEDGFELIVNAERAADVWRALRVAGAAPCGLGARDALRIEAGYPLYGHEIDDTTSPVEAGLMWVVKTDNGDFVGREAILSLLERGPSRRLVGFLLEERAVPRTGYPLHVGADRVGAVTSGVFSPTLCRGIGMAYVDVPHHRTGTRLELVVRDKRFPAIVVPKKSLLANQPCG